MLEALADDELGGYEERCSTWLAARETHTNATFASLIRRAGEKSSGNRGTETIPS